MTVLRHVTKQCPSKVGGANQEHDVYGIRRGEIRPEGAEHGSWPPLVSGSVGIVTSVKNQRTADLIHVICPSKVGSDEYATNGRRDC